MPSTRILVVDDHEIIRRGLRSILNTHHGWELCGDAIDGEDAIVKARSLKPDVIILDISMPNLGGLEAAREIKKSLPATAILFVTYDTSEILPLALQVGGQAVLSKYDLNVKLVPAIQELLEP
jgi:DNA-binding NarL/FixJ family response regulator